MATYPYISTQAALLKTFDQFRKSFPATVDSGTLKRFGIAPGNESYVINILRFLGVIDDAGKRDEDATKFFYGSDDDFAKGMEALVQSAYATLFEEYGPGVWEVDRARLVIWFRTTDKTSELIGGRQAGTFQTLAALGGHGEAPKPSTASSTSGSRPAATAKKPITKTPATPVKENTVPVSSTSTKGAGGASDFGLSVRVEVNLPADATPQTYDAIFASIRKNLIDPK